MGTAIGVMVVAVIAAMTGDARLAARMHGAIADHGELLGHTVVGAHRAIYEGAMGAVRGELGDDDFARCCGEGAAWGWTRMEHEVLTFADSTAAPVLTPRQLEILKLLAAGMTNKEISARLTVAPKTTMHHTSNIYQRLGVRGRGEAVAWGRRAGLV